MAIHINTKVYKGQKTTTRGIDLDFTRNGNRYIVAIKSSPKWGNSGQIEHLGKKFAEALKTLRTSKSGANALCVNGCCYGKVNIDKGNYLIRSGQKFWELISGDDELYVKIIEPLGHKAKESNEEYLLEYGKIETAMTEEFTKNYCKPDKSIDWDKIVTVNAKAFVPKQKVQKLKKNTSKAKKKPVHKK